MKDNVETLHEREGNLEDLESRATELEEQTVSLLIKVRVVFLLLVLHLKEEKRSVKRFRQNFLFQLIFFLEKRSTSHE
jgi:type III secretory pathway component EscS